VLNRVHVRRHPTDQIADFGPVVKGERQALDVMIERLPEVMHDPLPNPGGEITLDVRSYGAHGGDCHGRNRGEVNDRQLALAEHLPYEAGYPLRQRARAEAVIENDLDRPGLERTAEAFD